MNLVASVLEHALDMYGAQSTGNFPI